MGLNAWLAKYFEVCVMREDGFSTKSGGRRFEEEKEKQEDFDV